MGQGGFMGLVNGTRYDWIKTYQHSYQMEAWSFPDTVQAGTSISVYVEWNDNVFKTTSDDAGEATYKLAGTDLQFEVQAVSGGGRRLQVLFKNLATPGNPNGSVINLGWNHDGYHNFILSGEVGRFTSSNLPTSWMQNNLNILGNRTLRDICIPGSHDAGMNARRSGTAFAYNCNTVTQTKSILDQLQCGVRYFDIRPVISAGTYTTGHYGYINQISSWQGANGQSIESIVNDINRYTDSNKELIILNLSHDFNTDVGNASYRPFSQSEWNGLFSQMQRINSLFSAQNPTDLTSLKLNDFIGGNRAAVVIFVSTAGVDLGSYANRGFYSSSQFRIYDVYSETNNVDQMVNDQLNKMMKECSRANKTYFILSWTLTQNTVQATTCDLGTAYSILDLANIANIRLYNFLLSACSKYWYPNVIYTDGIQSSDTAALAMAINNKVILNQDFPVYLPPFVSPTYKWTQIGGPANSIVITSDQLYGLSPDKSGVWKYNGSPNNWMQVGGPATALVDGGNTLYAISPQGGNIWQYNGTPNNWTQIGGPGSAFAVAGGVLYGLSPNLSGVWRYNGTPNNWTQIGGPATRLVGKGNTLYAVSPEGGNIWQYNGTPNNWTQIGGPGATFAAAGGVLYGLSPNLSGVWRYNGTPNSWTQVGGPATALVGGGNTLYAISPDRGFIWQYSGTPNQWKLIGGAGSEFVASGNSLYKRDAAGVWQYNP